MGNIHSGINNYVERFPLAGDSAEIVLRKTKNCGGRQVTDTWTAEYVGGMTSCKLGLTKINRNKRDEELFISLRDHAPAGSANDDVDLLLDVRVEDDHLLAKFTINGPRSCLEELPQRKIPIADGGVIKSSSFLYGSERDRKGLIVILRAKRRDDDEEWPYMITVKHFFVRGSSHVDVGLSVVAKIRNDNGESVSLQLENPVTQPKSHLLSMFNDVRKTGWRPNPSSDCTIVQKEIMSESDHSLSIQKNGGKNIIVPVAKPKHYPPFSYSISSEQNVTSLLSTSGFTNGDYNGALIFKDCHISFDYTRNFPGRSL